MTSLLVAVAAIPGPAIAAETGEPVTSEIVIAVPASAIWNAYTVNEEIEAWMTPSSEINLAIGGEWLTSYAEGSALDDDSVVHNEILAFDSERMLAVRTVKPPADFPFPNAILDTWTVLYLQPVDDNQTKVVMRMSGFGSDEESEAMREFFEWGNQYELERLKEYLESR
jgi:uncharacterized protein YndB with AHSA1/START domain